MVTSDNERGTARSTMVLFVSLSGWLAGPGRNLATLLTHLPPDINADWPHRLKAIW